MRSLTFGLKGKKSKSNLDEAEDKDKEVEDPTKEN